MRTAPGKRESYRRVLETDISNDPNERAAQLDENPGMWLRLHSKRPIVNSGGCVVNLEREFGKL